MRTGLLMAELPRAAAELGVTAALAPAPAAERRGDGHPVLVLPGFVQHDSSTTLLRAYLGALNYSVTGWRLGVNVGSRELVVAGLRDVSPVSRRGRADA